MKKYIDIIKKSSLFFDIQENDIEQMLNCLSAQIKQYDKNEYIFLAGENIKSVGMVLSGSIHIVNEDFWGNKTIISEFSQSDIFAETYACIDETPISVSVLANEKCTILFMDIKRMIRTCSSSCKFHLKLIQNIITVLASKNLILTTKMEHISKRTTREKLLSYLSLQSKKANSNAFDIPFNRQQLADYLSVDRSAMSSELSKLREEGIIEFNKNNFVINNFKNK